MQALKETTAAPCAGRGDRADGGTGEGNARGGAGRDGGALRSGRCDAGRARLPGAGARPGALRGARCQRRTGRGRHRWGFQGFFCMKLHWSARTTGFRSLSRRWRGVCLSAVTSSLLKPSAQFTTPLHVTSKDHAAVALSRKCEGMQVLETNLRRGFSMASCAATPCASAPRWAAWPAARLCR